jgi:hypothetical protein
MLFRRFLPAALLLLAFLSVEALLAQQSAQNDPIVYVTKTGEKYHVGSCRYLRQSTIAMKLSEAEKRYTPCSVCKPPRPKRTD